MAYVLVLLVFIGPAKEPYGYVAATNIANAETCQILGERAINDQFNPSQAYTCNPVGRPS